MTDEMIRALADHGGVMGLNFCPEFLTRNRCSLLSDIQRELPL